MIPPIAYQLSLFVYVAENMMDFYFSQKDLKSLWKDNRKLYLQGKILEFINIVCIGPFLYSCMTPFVIDELNTMFQFYPFLFMILAHNMLYYIFHLLMHQWDCSIHDFHHHYSTLLLPSTANTVSIGEFLFAYLSPLFISAYFLQPTEITFLSVVALITVFNLFVHTKEFEHVPYSNYFVSPEKHIQHHRKRQRNFASPLLNIDYILSQISKNKNEAHSL